MEQFVILMYGPPCSGKSATALQLMARHDGLFRVSQDRIKWFVSGYGGGPYRKEISRLAVDMASAALTQGFSLVVEANATILKKMWPKYEALAVKHGVTCFEVNLEAPLEMLKERLEKRMVRAKLHGHRHTLKEPDDLERRYHAYLAYKKNSIPTLDSSVLSLEDIAIKIEEMVGLSHPDPTDSPTRS